MGKSGLKDFDPNVLGGGEIPTGFDEAVLAGGGPAVEEQNPKKLKAKRYRGMLEWILDRDGHEFLVAVDRNFIRDESNLIGFADKLSEDLNIPKEILLK